MKRMTQMLAVALAVALLPAGVRAQGPDKAPDVPPLMRAAGKVLTKEERIQLREALEEVREDPRLQSARDQLDDALLNMRETLRQVVLEEDPGLEPVLDRIAEEIDKRKEAFGGRAGRRDRGE